MVVLIVVGVVWLFVRGVAAWRMTTHVSGAECPTERHQDAAGPQDARVATVGIAPADLARNLVVVCSELVLPALTAATLAVEEMSKDVRGGAMGRRRLFGGVVRGGGARGLAGGPRSEGAAPMRVSFLDALPRPDAGPPCLGGRDDDAYLRGWDDAVDWVGHDHDAQAPTWGGVAYMTGWNDAVQGIDQARKVA